MPILPRCSAVQGEPGWTQGPGWPGVDGRCREGVLATWAPGLPGISCPEGRGLAGLGRGRAEGLCRLIDPRLRVLEPEQGVCVCAGMCGSGSGARPSETTFKFRHLRCGQEARGLGSGPALKPAHPPAAEPLHGHRDGARSPRGALCSCQPCVRAEQPLQGGAPLG